MPEIVVSADARDDLAGIDRYSLECFGQAVADEYMKGFHAVFDRLAQYPESGPLYREVTPAIRCVTYRSHRLFYDFDGRTVVILRVIHSAMNATRILN